jgi:hypothetical protein
MFSDPYTRKGQKQRTWCVSAEVRVGWAKAVKSKMDVHKTMCTLGHSVPPLSLGFLWKGSDDADWEGAGGGDYGFTSLPDLYHIHKLSCQAAAAMESKMGWSLGSNTEEECKDNVPLGRVSQENLLSQRTLNNWKEAFISQKYWNQTLKMTPFP